MDSRTVSYTLVAHATGIEEIRAVRREIESIAAVRFNFESQVQNIRTVAQAAAQGSVDQQAAERARQSSLNASTASMNKLGTAVTDLTARLASMGSKGTAAAGGAKAVDAAVRVAAQGLSTLTNAYVRGGISQAEFVQKGAPMKAYLAGVSAEFGRFSKEAGLAERALKAAASTPVTAAFRQEQAAAREMGQTINQLRIAWQVEQKTEAEAATEMAAHQRSIMGKIDVLELEKKTLLEKGVLDQAETRRVQELTGLQNTYSQALRATDSVMKQINDQIQKGSLAASVKAGAGGQPAPVPPATIASINTYNQSLKTTTSEVQRLKDAETAGILTKKELAAALLGEVNSQRAALTEIQGKIAGLRTLGTLDVQQTEQLLQLTAAENGYTGALARSITAQREAATSSNVLRQGMTAAGGRGAGIGNLAMGASMVSPELGMVSMLAQTGPTVAGIALVGLGIKKVVDLTIQGQDEAKKLQQAYLVMSANGITDIKSIDDSLNHIITHGSDAEKMFSKAELAQALASLARGGVKGADALLVLKTSAQLAAAEHISLGDATTRLYGNLQHFNLTAAESATFGDKLARASHMSMATMDELSKGLVVVGQTMKESGFSIDETLGMLVDLAKKGMDPATIGANGLRNAVMAVQHPSKQAAADFAALGVAVKDTSGHARSGRDIMMDLQGIISSSGPVYDKLTGHLITHNDAVKMIFDMFKSRGATAFMSILGNVGDLTAEIGRSKGFLEEYSSTVVGGLEGAQKRLDASTKNLSSSFAQIFTPALTGVVKLVQGGVTDLNDFVTQLAAASAGVDKFASLKHDESDSPLLQFLKTVNNAVADIKYTIASVADGLNSLSNFTGLHKVGDTLVSAFPALGDDAQRNQLDQQKNLAEVSAARAQLVVLQKQLALAKADPKNSVVRPQVTPLIDNVITGGVAAPASSHIQDLEKAIAGLATTIATGEANLKKLRTASGIGGGFVAGPNVIPMNVGNEIANTIVDNCAKWVRLSLDKQNPNLTNALNKLFQGNPGPTGIPSADSAKANFSAANLLHPYTGIRDLQAGDTVFYDGNHVGRYIGNGLVRGNNEVTYKANGGTYTNGKADNNASPVGDVYITDLGHVAGFARLSEIAAKFGNGAPAPATSAGTPTPASAKTPPEMAPGFKPPPIPELKALQTEFTKLRTLFAGGKMDVDAYHAALDTLRSKATQLADTQKTGSKEWVATEALIRSASSALKTHVAGLSQYGQTYDRLKGQLSVVDDLGKLGTSSADTLKSLDSIRAAASGAAGAEKARNGETEKYRQLLSLAAEAAGKAKTIRSGDAAETKRVQQQQSQAAATERQRVADDAQFAKSVDQQLASGKVASAQASIRSIEAARDADLKDVKGNVQQQLDIEQKRGAVILTNQLKVLSQQRVQAIQAAHDAATASRAEADKRYKGKVPSAVSTGIDQLETAAVGTAWSTYGSESSTAESVAAGRVTDAHDKLTTSVSNLRDKYHTLADSIREQTLAGTFDSAAKQKALTEFNKLGREVEDAGLTNQTYIKGARTVTFSLVDQGTAAYLTAQRMQGMVSGNEEAANSALQLATDLQSVGDEQGGLAVLQKTYDDLDASLSRGEASAASVDKVRVALETLRDSVTLTADFNTFVQGLTGSLQDEMGQIADKILDPKTSNKLRARLKAFQVTFSQDASNTILQAARDANTQAGDATSTSSELAASDINSANHDFVTGLFKGPDQASKATAFLSGPDGLFGAAFWSQLGEEGRAEFTANLAKLTPADFKGVSSATLKGLIESIGDDPDWAGLKKTLTEGLTANNAADATSANFASLGDLIGKGQGALDNLSSGKTTASEYARVVNTDLIPALQLISSTAADAGVKEMADKAIAALTSEAVEAQKLADLLVQVKLARLDVDKASGAVSEKTYIDQRQKLQADQENANYSEIGLTGTALLVHQQEHQSKLTQITTEGDKARADLALRLQTQTLATQNQRDADNLTFQHDQHLISDAAFQQAQESQQAAVAQRAFDLKTQFMKRDSDEYRVEAAQLEVDLTKIHNQGILDRIKLDSGQTLLDSQKQNLQSLRDNYAQGSVGTVDTSAQAIVLAQSLDKEAAAAARAGRLVLASQFRDQAAAARELAGPLGVLAEKLNDYSQYAVYVGDLAGAFGKLAGALGEGEQEYDRAGKKLNTPMKDLAANLNGVQKAAQLVSSALTDVAKIAANPADIGSWVHLAVSVIGSIADAIGGFKKAYAQAKQTQADFNAGFTLINGDDYSKSFVRSRGFLADVFGGGPEVVQEVDKVGLVFAKTMEQGFVTGITGGLKDALSKNDFGLFQKSLRSSVYDATVQGLTDAFLNDTLKATIAPAIKAWSDALKTPGTEDDQAAIAGLDAAITAANAQGQAFYTSVAPMLTKLKPVDDGTTTSGSTSSSFGAVATAGQLAVGTDFLDASTLINSAALQFDGTIKRAEAMYQDVIAMYRDVLHQGIPIGVEVNTTSGPSGQGQGTGLNTRSLR